MGHRLRAVFGLLIAFGALEAHSQACTINISPGASLTGTTQTAPVGAVICLSAGTYNPIDAGPYASGQANHAISKNNITVRGAVGTTPSQVIIAGAAGSDYAVKFFQYGGIPQPSGVTIQGVTIQGSQGGVQIWDFQTAGRLADITLRDVIITTVAGGAGHGVLVSYADRIVLDNVTITSNQTAINLRDSNDSLVMNSTVVRATGAAGLSVIGGSNNVIVGNTIGSPKVGPTYSFQTGGVVFYNTRANRFEGNVVQGMQFDGVDWTALDGTPFGLPPGQAMQNSIDNYAGKNRVISTGLADGLPGGSGMWANCGSDNTWLYANEAHGSVECGICVWLSRSNMLLGNKLYNHGITGIFDSGGAETIGDCPIPAYRRTPMSNYFQSNSLFFNRNDQMTVRNSANHEISRNYTAPTNGFGGGPQTCLDVATCQAAFTFDADSSVLAAGGHRIVANTSHGNKRGLWSPDQKIKGLQFYLNRIVSETFSRYSVPSITNIDGGPVVGGSYWSQHVASGNPSSTAYSGVIDNSGSPTVGLVVDRHPFQSENLGKGFTPTVLEPRLNSSVAQGTMRTVRWNAPGCTMVDLFLDNVTSLQTNVGNTGYAVVTIPGGTGIGAHFVTVRCKDSSGTTQGQANSPTFNVTSSALQLLAPGRDDVLNAGSQVWVAWKRTAAITSVAIDLSTDGGASFPTTLASINNTYQTAARVTLPAGASTAYAVLRVRFGANIDQTDGVFAIRGSSGYGFTAANMPGGRTFVEGAMERLEWASPPDSRLVDITALTDASLPVVVASNLPDRGSFDWVAPDLGNGAVSLQIAFKRTDGTIISAAPARMSNISTRMQVLTGNDVLIGGFIIGGGVNKTVVVRARGPSLVPFGITNALMNPTLQLVRSSDQTTIAVNDDWQSATNQAAVTASGFAPSDSRESAILVNLAPGAYTAIVSGVGGTGVGIVEVFEVDQFQSPLANISTRGQIRTGNDVMIGGFVVSGDSPRTVVVRARGPSLVPFGITNAIADPMIQVVRSSDQLTLATNDNWQTHATAGAVSASGFAPSNALESAVYLTLPPGAYTVIVSGIGGGQGVGIVEVFAVQ